MRTTAPALAGAAVVGLAATAALALPASSASVPPAEHARSAGVVERGVVLECTGSAGGVDAYVNVYENSQYSHYLHVVLNDDPQQAASREPADLWRAGRVRGAIRVAGKRAVVHGTAVRVGRPKRVHEEIDDAGQRIVSDGVHRRLRTHLVLSYDGVRVPLTCDPAFAYRLRVTRTDATGG